VDPKRLWAKSKPDSVELRESMYLQGHLKDVYTAADKVIAATGLAQLAALGLDPAKNFDRFRKCVLFAAAVHDLGKANDHFQGMICRAPERRDKQQAVRHEWITILILQELRGWLRPVVSSDIDWHIVEWAVSGHHPAHNHSSPPRSCPPGSGVEIRIRSQEADFTDCLNWIGTTFREGVAPPKLQTQILPLTGAGNACGIFAKWFKNAQRVWEVSIRKTDDAKLLAAVKNCLVAADIAGSALPKDDPNNPDRWEKIPAAFADVPEAGDLGKIVEKRLGSGKPRTFQQSLADSQQSVTYVKAGCGSGKTLGAYMWAAKNHPTRRLYFCYPTTGTATEGFKDYLFEPEGELGELGSKLFHSRSRIDREIILGNARDSESPEADEAHKADALDSWSTPIVACTVDTVLGIVQNNKRGLFGWPALAQSAFVFDEIHAYDDRLFGALLRFLRDLPGLPALLMTASLPKPREDALFDVMKEFRGIDLMPIAGPKELEELPRYHKLAVPDCELLVQIQEEVKRGGKVLWVSNTVNRVIDSADAATAAGLKPLIYHSRFKYTHRVERHKAVVEAFDPKTTHGVLACTSQVCEMSLDLKGCTLLVTDNATVPALIQRLGRLNRQAKPKDPTRPFVVVPPENNLPYTPAELEAANEWLGKLPAENISQTMLAEVWESSSENPPDLVPSAWLDGGPMTTVCELREASPGITVILRSDVKKCHKSSDLGKYTLPMPPPPKAFDWRNWPKLQGIPIVEDALVDYHEMRGAKWPKQ
jgi:CRISPR-associated endonuclease/helicase Cas3